MQIEKLYGKDIDDILDFEEFSEKFENQPSEEFLKEVHKKYQYRSQEEALRTLQVELLKLQEHLEKKNEKMIILI